MGFKSEILSYLFEEQYIHFEFDASKTFPKKKGHELVYHCVTSPLLLTMLCETFQASSCCGFESEMFLYF